MTAKPAEGGASIATRLFASAAILSAVILFIAGIVLSTIYRRTTEAAFDERLNVYLKELVGDLSAPTEQERNELGNLGEPRFNLQGSGWYWEVTKADGGTFKASRSLFGQSLPKLGESVPLERFQAWRRGYVSLADDKRLRIIERPIDLGEDGQFEISVAADATEVEDEIKEFELALGLTFLLLGVALVGSALFQVTFGLRPLTDLRRAVSRIREGDAERIEGDYPRDVAPLADELNLLIDANREILDRARTQVGNLAHALKTPLSVMTNEVDAAGGPLTEKINEQVGLMRHQIDYYLNRARAAALAGALGAATDVKPTLEGLTRAFSKIYRERDFDLETPEDSTIRFRGEKQDFEEMVGNLIDNAGKYSKLQVKVSIGVEEAGDRRQLALVVDDDGPGLPPDKRDGALRRGERLDETKPGSGLGLSIVRDLAAMYGGKVEFETAPLGGLRARLLLPAV
ncbi:ATP-binding protein [Terrarubrum flagellatum]|uniref:ATP-binding protein n=1 Tax=Terrirubrum flagellatum TaxID=2895980 RepID=UPI003144E28C